VYLKNDVFLLFFVRPPRIFLLAGLSCLHRKNIRFPVDIRVFWMLRQSEKLGAFTSFVLRFCSVLTALGWEHR
jgi:hypothetical protein